jgi:hypothetical protein
MEMKGDAARARAEYVSAAAAAANWRERHYLTLKAARLGPS